MNDIHVHTIVTLCYNSQTQEKLVGFERGDGERQPPGAARAARGAHHLQQRAAATVQRDSHHRQLATGTYNTYTDTTNTTVSQTKALFYNRTLKRTGI